MVSEIVPEDLVVSPGETAEYTFTTTFASVEAGTYSVAFWTDLEGDGQVLNDTSFFTFTVAPVVSAYPYFQDFESGDGGWSQDDASQAGSWAFGEPIGIDINMAASGQNAWVTNLAGDYNSSEFSYLLSPCLDFSTLTEDPTLSFSLFFDTESCCDEGWVEVSIDDGESWEKVGTSGSGINWYNDAGNDWWDGAGGFEGWVTAANTLTGTAGEASVKIRFVLSTDGSVQNEGIAVDDVFITEPLDIDLSSSAAAHSANEECGDDMAMLTFTITNAGQSAQSGFTVSYQAEGADIVTEMVPEDLTLDAGESYTHTFATTFDASAFADYNIAFWATQAGDGFLLK